MASRLLVMGAGSWGTALAILLARNGYHVALWAHDPVHVAIMRRERRNRRYLPEYPFPDTLVPIAELSDPQDDVLLAVPLKGIRATIDVLSPHLANLSGIAWAAKGVEANTHLFIHQIIAECLGQRQHRLAVISGPSFAREVARGQPTAVTVASSDIDFAQHWLHFLHGGSFRAYLSTDVMGVEVCGAVKNVLAIAAGVADGLNCGANARAALITRGLAEMSRFGVAAGGCNETFTGLAGLGDLVLTCTDDQSRNRRVGLALGQGASLSQALSAIGQVAEGVATAKEVACLAAQVDVEMPITQAVVQILSGNWSPDEAMQALLARAPKHEHA